MDKQRLQELAGMQLNEASTSETVYIIKHGDGGYVDKGGRKSMTIMGAFMWKSKDKADAYLKQGAAKIYRKPEDIIKHGDLKAGESNEWSWDGWNVVPVTMTVGK